MDKQKATIIVGLLVILAIVLFLPFDRQEGEFSKILRSIGSNQEVVSEQITSTAVSGMEGSIVGEHQINGANWSIPNLIRHFLGVD